MAKMSRLEMVKSILSDMDSDEIAAIGDTVESEQVDSILKDVYNQTVAEYGVPEVYHLTSFITPTDWATSTSYKSNDVVVNSNRIYLCTFPHTSGTFTTDLTNGAWLTLPRTVFMMSHRKFEIGLQDIHWIKYNKIQSGETVARYSDIKYLSPKDFIDLVLSRDNSLSTVDEVSMPMRGDLYGSGVQQGKLFIENDTAPTYWTSFDDRFVIMDSYDSDVDTNRLLETKALLFARISSPQTDWSSTDDDYIPNLDETLFPFLLAEAKSLCFYNLKQQGNPKIDQMARSQKIGQQNKRYRTADQNKASRPDFGRK